MDSQTFFTIVLAAIFSGSVGVGLYAMSVSAIEPRLARWCVLWAWISALTLFIWYGGTNDMPRVGRYILAGGMAALVTVLCCIAIEYIGKREKAAETPTTPISPPSTPPAAPYDDDVLPGFSWSSVFTMSAIAEISRQYVFEFSTPEGARVAFYLSESNRFTFTVIDRNGAPYSIEVPLGRDGIPIARSILLYCAVGSGSNYAFMRVYMNGKEIAGRDFQFPIDMGSRQWIDGTIGANLGHGNGSSFSMQETMFNQLTMSASDLQTYTESTMNFYHITNSTIAPPPAPMPQ